MLVIYRSTAASVRSPKNVDTPSECPSGKTWLMKCYLDANRKIAENEFSAWGLLMSKDDGKLRDFWRKRAAKIEKALLNKSWTRTSLVPTFLGT
jgi:hypothetical protein